MEQRPWSDGIEAYIKAQDWTLPEGTPPPDQKAFDEFLSEAMAVSNHAIVKRGPAYMIIWGTEAEIKATLANLKTFAESK